MQSILYCLQYISVPVPWRKKTQVYLVNEPKKNLVEDCVDNVTYSQYINVFTSPDDDDNRIHIHWCYHICETEVQRKKEGQDHNRKVKTHEHHNHNNKNDD